MIKYFRGKPIEDLSRAELLELVQSLAAEVQRLKAAKEPVE